MLLFTPHGVNLYALMLQQLHSWHVDWGFMDDWIPFHGVAHYTVRYVVHFYDPSEYPTHPQQVLMMSMLYDRHSPLHGRGWVAPNHAHAPSEAFVDSIFTGAPLYRPILHMVFLHHGRIPTRDPHRVFRWLRRLRLRCARRVLLPRLKHSQDAVDSILAHCNAAEVCHIWSALDPNW
jgi:hypothetical protein